MELARRKRGGFVWIGLQQPTANEIAVARFLAGGLAFTDIVATVEAVVAAAPFPDEPRAIDDVLDAEDWARARTGELVDARGR